MKKNASRATSAESAALVDDKQMRQSRKALTTKPPETDPDSQLFPDRLSMLRDDSAQDEGRKNDKDKPDLRQLRNLPNALAAICRVLDYGAKEYGPANFAKVSSERYDKAMIRHALSEGRDAATGELHVAHVACCALIYLENLVTGKAEPAKEEDGRE